MLLLQIHCSAKLLSEWRKCTVIYYVVTLTLSVVQQIFFFIFSYAVIGAHASSAKYCLVQYLIVFSLSLPLPHSVIFLYFILLCCVYVVLSFFCFFLFSLPTHLLQTFVCHLSNDNRRMLNVRTCWQCHSENILDPVLHELNQPWCLRLITIDSGVYLKVFF